MHKQYLLFNHRLSYMGIQLTTDWLLVKTKLCKTTITGNEKFTRLLVTHDCQHWGIFRMCILLSKHIHVYMISKIRALGLLPLTMTSDEES